MQTVWIALSSILSVISILPYLSDVVRKKTKPRVVSWVIWSLLSGITAAAAFSDKQYPTFVMTAVGATLALVIAILGWRYGDRKSGRLDTACLAGALVGIGLWYQFDSPALAVIAVVIIDIIGSIPTVLHAWQKPHEETWSTFVMWSVSAVFTLLAIRQWQITSYLAPVYYIFMNTVIVLVILIRHKHSVKGKPGALYEV